MVELLRGEADEVLCLDEDPGFGAVGQYYIDFSQVSDEEVLETLKAFPAKKQAARSIADPSRSVRIGRHGVQLAGVLTKPATEGPLPLVIFVHGLGSSKESPRNVVISDALVHAGIATLLFDLSGHGESSIDPSDGLDAYVADFQAAYEWASEQSTVQGNRIGVAGSSLGAVVAAKATAEGGIRPTTMVLRAPPLEPRELQQVKIPSLVIVGSLDPLKDQVEEGVRSNPRLHLAVVEGASQLLEEPSALDEALRLTVDWFSSQLNPAAADEPLASSRSTSRSQ
jgi:putative phosphoribosyl transferase